MVKGLSRRVVVLDAPEQSFFEQAIFIVRNDAASEGVTARELVSEARRIAGDYAGGERRMRRLWKKYAPLVSALMGAAIVGLIWLTAALF